jgi:3-phenylpropionate/trans-cinnamate dioxygenase ferredoxin reductase subunit
VQRIVIVGGGLAGFEAARALRQQEFSGELVMLAAESEPPYDRPPLSKDLLMGREPKIHFDLGVIERLELRLGTSARRLGEGEVETDDGVLAADGVLLAVGADPIALPGASTLRTHQDARDLYQQLYPGAVVAVIGAGWIGAEVASAAAEAGCIVTLYEAMDSPLATALPADFGLLTAPWYEQAGIDLRLGERVDDITALGADVVVAGLGARPATGWLRGSGLDLREGDGAVVVDEFLRASMPSVVAVGDCAAWWSRRYDRRLRVEHWDTALHAPTVAAASVCGRRSDPYDPVPYFWSDQFGHNLQFAGYRMEDARVVMRGSTTDATWAVGWVRETADGPSLAAILTLDRPRDLTQARRAMSAEAVIDVERFADPETPVKAALIS